MELHELEKKHLGCSRDSVEARDGVLVMDGQTWMETAHLGMARLCSCDSSHFFFFLLFSYLPLSAMLTLAIFRLWSFSFPIPYVLVFVSVLVLAVSVFWCFGNSGHVHARASIIHRWVWSCLALSIRLVAHLSS